MRRKGEGRDVGSVLPLPMLVADSPGHDNMHVTSGERPGWSLVPFHEKQTGKIPSSIHQQYYIINTNRGGGTRNNLEEGRSDPRARIKLP